MKIDPGRTFSDLELSLADELAAKREQIWSIMGGCGPAPEWPELMQALAVALRSPVSP